MKKALLSALILPACLLLAVPAMADDDDNAAPAAAAAEAEPAAAPPCTGDNCPKPKSGYDWAAEHNITDVKDCTEGDQDYKDGCALYVHEKDIDAGEKEFEGGSDE